MRLKFYEIIVKKVRPIEIGVFLKFLLQKKRKVVDLDNFKLYIDPVTHFGLKILKDKVYEPELSNIIIDLLEEGDVFVDIGANEGYYSVLASKIVGNKGRVIAIEPQQRLWEIIMKNVSINSAYNISLLPFAIGAVEEQIEMVLSPVISSGSSSILKSKRSIFWRKQKAEVKKLDTIIQSLNLSTIKLLKIDIEGFEFFALKSAQFALSHHNLIEHIIVEMHPKQLQDMGQTPEEIASFLHSFGYEASGKDYYLFSKKL